MNYWNFICTDVAVTMYATFPLGQGYSCYNTSNNSSSGVAKILGFDIFVCLSFISYFIFENL